MAIKGKRKSQKKTKPTRPRPASPARAPRSATAHVPFHRTFEGQFAAIIVGLVIAGFAMFSIAGARAEEARDAAKADEIKAYTTEIKGLLASVNEAVREITGAPLNTDDRAAIADLKSRAKGWIEDLEGAGALAHGVVAPADLAPVNRVFAQGFQVYSGVAKTLRLVPDADRSLQQDLLDRAIEQRTVANDMLISAIQMLDLVRAEVGLDPSELQSPGTLPPIVPTPAASPTPEAGDSQGGKKGDGKRGGKGDKGDE
ncbi:MAG TPA: hypothetical protein VG408_01655 [Actinomycetota bacterium]|nr:hypothetical protein [Actinomycetota bacterium]